MPCTVDGMQNTTHDPHLDRTAPAAHHPDPTRIVTTVRRRSFATLATTSPAGVPHVAGVLFEIVGNDLYVNTLSASRKARNVAANGRAAVCVPIRRLPVGPPSSVQFQSTAEVVAVDDERVLAAVDRGQLSSLTSHGELDLPDGCFLRIALPPRLVTYGLGMSVRALIADPLGAAGAVEIDAWS